MLSEIMKTFRETSEPMDLKELSRRLDVDRSALEGMLATLVRQGKLRKVAPGTSDCAGCNRRFTCAKIQTGRAMPKTYELAADLDKT